MADGPLVAEFDQEMFRIYVRGSEIVASDSWGPRLPEPRGLE